MSRATLGVRPEVEQHIAVRSLPPRPRIWPARAFVVFAIALVVCGIAAALGRADFVAWGIVLAVLVIAGTITFGHRSWKRGHSIDLMIEAVNSVVRAAAPTRDLVTVSQWKGGWIGQPQRILVRYPSDLVDADPKFEETMVVQITNRMGQKYRIKKNDSRKCIITLVVDNSPAPLVDEDRARLESILSSVIPGVAIDQLTRGEESGLVDTVIFRWPASSTSRASKKIWQSQAIAAVQSALDRPMTISFDLTADVGTVRPLIPLPDVVPHPPRNDEEPMKVAFGQFRDGTPCIWDLDAPLPHVLIVGGTGGGKTILLLSILTALPNGRRGSAAGEWVEDPEMPHAEIWPIDPKRLGLFNLSLIPGAQPAATREAAIVSYILAVKKKMDDRYEYLESNGPHLRETLSPLVLTVDEGEEMAELLNEWWVSGEGKVDWCQRMGLEKAPTGTKHPVMTSFGSVLRLGREARVHVILASQQAAATWLSTSSRSQFAVRIALRNLELSTSIMTFGSPVATSGLENKPGRAWVSTGMGVQPEHAQIYWTPKLAPGLKDADRQILHGLGLLLPDDPDFVANEHVKASNVDVELIGELDTDAVTQESETPQRHLHLVDDVEESESNGGHTVEMGISDLELGMSILVDVDGHATPATVESVEIDTEDPDYLVLSYLTDDGEVGQIAVPDDEQVTVRIA